MENPLKSLRLSLGWSQQALAEHVGMSRQTVMRTEQGLYERPPVGLLTTLAPYLGGSPETAVKTIEQRYDEWVKYHRRTFGPKLRLNHSPSVNLHPLVQCRNASKLSQIGLCKLLCVNPGPVHKFELGQQIMPYQLESALIEAGFAPEQVLWLKKASAKFKEGR